MPRRTGRQKEPDASSLTKRLSTQSVYTSFFLAFALPLFGPASGKAQDQFCAPPSGILAHGALVKKGSYILAGPSAVQILSRELKVSALCQGSHRQVSKKHRSSELWCCMVWDSLPGVAAKQLAEDSSGLQGGSIAGEVIQVCRHCSALSVTEFRECLEKAGLHLSGARSMSFSERVCVWFVMVRSFFCSSKIMGCGNMQLV